MADASPACGTVALRDGRRLELMLGGDPAGPALVLHHGTPSDATVFADWDAPCRARGLRLVALSRPGYAGSPRLPGRDVAQAASDVADVLDGLGHARFATVGWSGGGPHALACAAILGDRCATAATLGGAAPAGRDDLDFLAGMGPENLAEFAAAAAGEATLRAWLGEHAEPFRHVTAAELGAVLGGLAPAIDRDALAAGYADVLAATSRRALAPGFDGWIDDDLAFVRPWGFAPEAIAVPVTVWQGELDLMVPFAHGRWLVDHVPQAQARIVPGHGHISLVTALRDAILDDLAAALR